MPPLQGSFFIVDVKPQALPGALFLCPIGAGLWGREAIDYSIPNQVIRGG